jgi:hypothetical protein
MGNILRTCCQYSFVLRDLDSWTCSWLAAGILEMNGIDAADNALDRMNWRLVVMVRFINSFYKVNKIIEKVRIMTKIMAIVIGIC